jgi:hypothetical protein
MTEPSKLCAPPSLTPAILELLLRPVGLNQNMLQIISEPTKKILEIINKLLALPELSQIEVQIKKIKSQNT